MPPWDNYARAALEGKTGPCSQVITSRRPTDKSLRRLRYIARPARPFFPGHLRTASQPPPASYLPHGFFVAIQELLPRNNNYIAVESLGHRNPARLLNPPLSAEKKPNHNLLLGQSPESITGPSLTKPIAQLLVLEDIHRSASIAASPGLLASTQLVPPKAGNLAVSAVVRFSGQHPQRSREAREVENAQTGFLAAAPRQSGSDKTQTSKQPIPAPNPDYRSASSTGQDGQCPGPQGREGVGEQVSMSQRGPAAHTTKQAPTQSPPKAPFGSQQSPQARGSPGIQDAVTTPSTTGEGHPFGPRSLGIRGLINEAQPEGSAGEPSRPRGAHAQTSPYGMPPRQYGTPGDRQYTYQSQSQSQSHGSFGSQPATPAGHPATTPLGHTPSEHSSPKSGFPFPLMGAPRQMLSPRETRAASLSQAGMRGPEPHQTPFLPPRTKRPYPGDEGPSELLRTAPGHPFSGPSPHGPSSSGIGSLTTPPRSMSQPMIGHMPPTNPERPQLPPMTRDPHGRGPEYPGQPMLPPGHSFPPPQSSGIPVWSTPGAGTSLYQSLRSDVAKAEGGMVVRLPGEEGGILIPVDVHQGSKQADEKRQRNAGASARFRQRKKEKDQEQIANLQRLEQRSRDLEVKLRDMTQERDFYRDERNRLRDVVLRTPLSDMANGPPSPTSSRSGGSMAETSPLTQPPMLPHQSQQQGYASSEASSVDRPTRRRRTDSAQTPEFSMPSYGTPGPQAGNLPPLQAPASYGMMPQRSPSTAPGGERLPPLRTMEGSPFTGSDSGPSVSSGGPLYPSYTRVPHETGFASRTVGPLSHHSHHGHDGGLR